MSTMTWRVSAVGTQVLACPKAQNFLSTQTFTLVYFTTAQSVSDVWTYEMIPRGIWCFFIKKM